MASKPSQSFHRVNISNKLPEILSDAERRWADFQPYLLTKGYQLRPRYRPGWVPTWKSTDANPLDCEDSVNSLPVRVLDATRLSDQLQVLIKMIVPSDEDREGTDELYILQRFSSARYQSDPGNHTVPCLDSFSIPGVEHGAFCVMPLLTKYDEPPLVSLSDVHDFLTQIFEGLQFLHKHDVAHCDIASPNVMMNGRLLYDEAFHPVNQHLTLDNKRPIHPRYLRSQVPIRYYFIDFGYAKWFREPDEPRVITGVRSREITPEQVLGEPYDPFKADVFQLGAIIRRDLIPQNPDLQFLLPLAREMTQRNPNMRPSLEEARHTMNTQFVGLGVWRKRQPLLPPNASFGQQCVHFISRVTAEIVSFFKWVLGLLFCCN